MVFKLLFKQFWYYITYSDTFYSQKIKEHFPLKEIFFYCIVQNLEYLYTNKFVRNKSYISVI